MDRIVMDALNFEKKRAKFHAFEQSYCKMEVDDF